MPQAVTRASARTIVAVVVGLVVLTTVAFAVGTTHSGASTPEGAVRDLVGALEDGDVLGVLDALAPSEQRVLAEPVTDLAAALGAVGVVGSDDVGALDLGLEVRVEDLELAVEPLDEQVSFVDAVGGTVEVRVPPGALVDPSTAEALRRRADVELEDGLVWQRDLAESPLRFGVVDEGGGYHVSLAYTAAEQVRQASGAPLPDVETRPDAIGSTTPEEVVTDLFSAVAARYPRRVAELVSPYDGRALYDYATVWLPGLQAAADEGGGVGPGAWSLRVDDLAVEAEGEGGVRRVGIVRLDATLADGPAGQEVRVQVTEDGCTTITTSSAGPAAPPEVRRSCPGQGWTDAGGAAVDPGRVSLGDLLVLDGLGAERPTFTVIEREGRWFLSPTLTVLHSLVAGAEAAADDGPEAAAAWTADVVGLVLRAVDDGVQARP